MTSEDTPNAISLPVPGSGALGPELQAGPTTDLFGARAAPVSRSRRRAGNSAPMIQGICGRTYIGCSVPPAQQDSKFLCSWESRLRERLATIGSTESALIWRGKVSPQGQSISRLARSTLHTNGTGSGGALWPTPKSSAAGPDFAKVERSDTGMSLQTMMAATSYWPTAKASAAGESSRGGDRKDEPLIGSLMRMAHRVTPSARDWKDSAGMATTGPDDRNRIDQLPRQMVAIEVSGPTPNGLPATTAKRGAPNPIFACWLMGWPDELVSGALRGIQSFRSSRRKSSRLSSKPRQS